MMDLSIRAPKSAFRNRMSFRHYFWTPGEPWRSVRSWLVPRLLNALHSALMSTLRISISGASRLQPILESPERAGLLVTWHDLTLVQLHTFRDKQIHVMMSHSRSGQIQAALWRLNGFPTVWGSTKKREGVRALREALRGLRENQVFALTPDGPKGPLHRCQPGIVYLASNAPAPVIPIAVAAARFWRLRTWDRYLIPKPFSRVHVHIGEALQVPPDLEREAIEEWQVRIAEALDAAQNVARQRISQR